MIQILPLDLIGQGALLQPKDEKLHDAAVDFCFRELADGKTVDLSKFSKVWVGMRDGVVRGIAGYVLKPDVPLLRVTDAEVLRAMGMRLNNFFADNGCRGQEAFLYIGNEKPEQRCPEWRQVLCEFGAKSARRFAIEVK